MRTPLLIMLAVVTTAMVCLANFQIAAATEAAAKELIEVMLHEGGRAAATELSEMGGEAAVRQLMETAMNEGGEELVEQVARYGARYGPPALKAVERSPARMIHGLDGVSPDLVGSAISAAARDPAIADRLVAAYGKDGLEIMAKHPGVGATLAEKLGSDGIRIGRKLTTDQTIAFARYADDVAALPSGERGRLLDAVLKTPAAVLDYLERHPRVLLTAGGVAAVIAAKDNLLGRAAPSAATGELPPGLVERIFYPTLSKFTTPIAIVVVILICGIFGRVVIHLWSVWKSKTARLRMEEARLSSEKARLSNADRRTPH